jgi:hypothetical protein
MVWPSQSGSASPGSPLGIPYYLEAPREGRRGVSRAMLERYSHIRMAAKRDAMAGIRLHPQTEVKAENREVVPVKVTVGERPTCCNDLYLLDFNGERGRNRTYNLLIKRQCTGGVEGISGNVFNILGNRWSP